MDKINFYLKKNFILFVILVILRCNKKKIGANFTDLGL
jgi:hypothetical protein